VLNNLFNAGLFVSIWGVIELEDAQQRILEAVAVSTPETVALSEAHQRILASAIVSPVDLPAFDNSAMDGYAVRAMDVRSASSESPVTLHLSGRIAAGESLAGELQAGQCVRLFTGSPLPAGADAVVMQEDTATLPDRPAEVQILDAAKPWENVRLRGVDVKGGETICTAGEVLTAGRLALLAATGTELVQVGCRPRVALLATGSELCEPGSRLAAGQIYESNRLTLAALTRRAGGLPEVFPIIRDNFDDTCRALEQAFARADFVVTSGGVSVGELDFVKQAFTNLGGELGFWKVAMRPGKPFVFGRLGRKYLFGLPGNPVSAFVTFLLLVRPAIRRWQGAGDVHLPAFPAALGESLANPGNRRHFIRETLGESGQVRPAGLQQSHAMKSLAAGDGLIDLPAGAVFAAGSIVSVLHWD